jgi:hypothetical protein
VYVAPLRPATLRQVLGTLRGARVRSVTAVPEYVRDGVSVGIAVAAGRPRLVINLAASRAQGSDFSSQLLKLARVIR